MSTKRIKITENVTLVVKPKRWRSTDPRPYYLPHGYILGLARSNELQMPELRRLVNASPDTRDSSVISEIARGISEGKYALEFNAKPTRRTDISMGKLWDSYPHEGLYPNEVNDPNSIWKAAGGIVLYNATHADPGRPGHMIFEDSCAIRMSMAFNLGGLSIDPMGAKTIAVASGPVRGGYYIFRVSDFRDEVIRVFGPPTIVDKKGWWDEIFYHPGIVLFALSLPKATSYITLWDGKKLAEFDSSFDERHAAFQKVEFWEV